MTTSGGAGSGGAAADAPGGPDGGRAQPRRGDPAASSRVVPAGAALHRVRQLRGGRRRAPRLGADPWPVCCSRRPGSATPVSGPCAAGGTSSAPSSAGVPVTIDVGGRTPRRRVRPRRIHRHRSSRSGCLAGGRRRCCSVPGAPDVDAPVRVVGVEERLGVITRRRRHGAGHRAAATLAGVLEHVRAARGVPSSGAGHGRALRDPDPDGTGRLRGLRLDRGVERGAGAAAVPAPPWAPRRADVAHRLGSDPGGMVPVGSGPQAHHVPAAARRAAAAALGARRRRRPARPAAVRRAGVGPPGGDPSGGDPPARARPSSC